MNKIEYTVEKIENGYLLSWVSGTVDQYKHVWFYETTKELVGALEAILDAELPT